MASNAFKGLGASKYATSSSDSSVDSLYQGPMRLGASKYAPAQPKVDSTPAPTVTKDYKGATHLGASKHAIPQGKANPSLGPVEDPDYLGAFSLAKSIHADPVEKARLARLASAELSPAPTVVSDSSKSKKTVIDIKEQVGACKTSTVTTNEQSGSSETTAVDIKGCTDARKTGTVATKDENSTSESTTVMANKPIAIADEKESLHAGAQLALAQNENLKNEVENLCTTVLEIVKHAGVTIPKLLERARKATGLKNDAGVRDALIALDNVWNEVTKLGEAAEQARIALPEVFEKQKDSMSLFHNSVVNAAYLESQEELNAQYKKFKLQQDIILQHQQVFNDYKTAVDPQLDEADQLRERVHSMSLHKDQVQDELKDLQLRLETALAAEEENAAKMVHATKELGEVRSVNQELVDDKAKILKTIDELEKKVASIEKISADRLQQELQRAADQSKKDADRARALETLVQKFREAGVGSQQANDKLSVELKALRTNYENQRTEFSKCLKELNDAKEKNGHLSKEVHRLEVLIKKLEVRMETMKDCQYNAQLLTTGKTKADTQLAQLRKELEAANDKLKKTHKENEDLEEDNNGLLATIAEHKETITAQTATIAELLAEVAALQAAAKEHSSRGVSQDRATLEGDLSRAQEKISRLEGAVAEWKELANQSYKEYQQMLLLHKETDNLRKENEVLKTTVEAKDAEVKKTVKAKDTEVAHWRSKYNELLASLE